MSCQLLERVITPHKKHKQFWTARTQGTRLHAANSPNTRNQTARSKQPEHKEPDCTQQTARTQGTRLHTANNCWSTVPLLVNIRGNSIGIVATTFNREPILGNFIRPKIFKTHNSAWLILSKSRQVSEVTILKMWALWRTGVHPAKSWHTSHTSILHYSRTATKKDRETKLTNFWMIVTTNHLWNLEQLSTILIGQSSTPFLDAIQWDKSASPIPLSIPCKRKRSLEIPSLFKTFNTAWTRSSPLALESGRQFGTCGLTAYSQFYWNASSGVCTAQFMNHVMMSLFFLKLSNSRWSSRKQYKIHETMSLCSHFFWQSHSKWLSHQRYKIYETISFENCISFETVKLKLIITLTVQNKTGVFFVFASALGSYEMHHTQVLTIIKINK